MARILFLTESFHPVLGGGERHIRELAGHLAAGGWPMTVLTRRTDAGWPAEEALEGIRVLRVGPSGAGRSGKYRMVPAALAVLARERRSYDVLVVRGTRVLGLPGLLAARRHRKAVVLQPELNGEMTGEVFTWGTRFEAQPYRSAVRTATALRNRLFRDADAFVAMSRSIEEEFLAAGAAREKVVRIPHGVDTARFRPADPAEREALRRRWGMPAGVPIIIYTGRLLRGKGLEALVDAVAGLRQPAHLVMVGSGGDQPLSVEDELRDRVRAAGCGDRVTFTGRVDAVEDLLRAADLFAFPSVFEALGLSLIEAAACGLPAVGSRTGGIVDVIEDGRSGLLVPPADPASLREALAALLHDPARRQAMGTRARDIARARFDLADSVSLYRALFDEVAHRRGAGLTGRAA
ncbi:MAG TPA: glycosyltransferase family 4 protein [Vicinamibacteria bacterium]